MSVKGSATFQLSFCRATQARGCSCLIFSNFVVTHSNNINHSLRTTGTNMEKHLVETTGGEPMNSLGKTDVPPRRRRRGMIIGISLSLVGSMSVLSPAVLVLLNPTSLGTAAIHDLSNFLMVATVAIFLSTVQFLTCCYCILAKTVPEDVVWGSHLVVSTSLNINITFAFTNGMQYSYLGLVFLQFSCLNAVGCYILAICSQYAKRNAYVEPTGTACCGVKNASFETELPHEQDKATLV